MRVYIAGPMTGIPAFNYPAFHKAAGRLRLAGFDPVSPAVALVDGWGRPDYLRRAIRLLLDADAIALLPEWEDSPGACLESQIGFELGMPVEDLTYWLTAS